MPLDAAARGQPYSIVMPWAGRNAAIIARRRATPRLPPNWGASFARKLRWLGEGPAPMTEDDGLRALARGPALKDRLLALLHALAHRGEHLPSATTLADLLDIGYENAGQIANAFRRLAHDGDIVQRVTLFGPLRGSRVVRLADTGQHLRSANAPPDLVLG